MRPSPIFLLILGVAVVGAVLCTLDSQTTQITGVVLLVLGGWAVSLCVHEFGHAFVAFRGGDHSVVGKGYLTMDIRRYTDPVLSLIMPLLLLAYGGIPLPGGAVWINHHALRSKAVESSVSLAGPLSNLVLGALLIVGVNLGNPPIALAAGLSYLGYLQLIAFVLNILPIPGLDGFGALEPYLPPGAQNFAAQVRPYAPFALFALLIGVAPVAEAFFGAADWLFQQVGGYPEFAMAGQQLFMFWKH